MSGAELRVLQSQPCLHLRGEHFAESRLMRGHLAGASVTAEPAKGHWSLWVLQEITGSRLHPLVSGLCETGNGVPIPKDKAAHHLPNTQLRNRKPGFKSGLRT